MFDKEKAAKITLFASLGVMSLVLLITSSIWMNGFADIPFHNSMYDKAAVSVAFVVFGIVASGVSGFLVYKNGFDKISLLIAVAALVLFLIAVAVPMDNQKEIYTGWSNVGSPTTGLTAKDLAEVRIFPVALTFFLVPGIAFLGSGIIVAKNESLF